MTKISFFMKRHYMGKDVIDDQYGRLFNIPSELANQGIQVTCIVADYRNEFEFSEKSDERGVRWISIPLSSVGTYYLQAKAAAKSADLVISSSDCLQIVLGKYFAAKTKTPFIADLYDNYESFGLAKVPLMKTLYRRALKSSNMICCVGDTLNDFISSSYADSDSVVTLNSTIPLGQFFPADKSTSREALNLPADEKLIGVCGGLLIPRGIGYLYRAIEALWNDGLDFKFVIAGTTDPKCPPPEDDRVISMGNLPFDEMNNFYNALDVNIMHYIDNEFGAYCYPQKLQELVSSEVVIAAANVGEIGNAFASFPSVLYQCRNLDSIKHTIKEQLENPIVPTMNTQTWNEIARLLVSNIQQLDLLPKT